MNSRFIKFWGVVVVTSIATAPFVLAVSPVPAQILKAPLNGVTDLDSLVKVLIDAAFQIMLPIAVLAIMWAGFQYITALGDPGKVTAAKKQFYDVCIGVAILIGAAAAVDIIKNTIGSLK